MFFNVDAGEGFGNEQELFKYVDLANISCGAHAGSLAETERVMLLAQEMGVVIGAHPSYPDRENFGRVALEISHQELKESVKRQLSDFFTIADNNNLAVFHVKPHGALYHKVAQDNEIASLFFEALNELSFSGAVVGLPNSLFSEYCRRNKVVLLKEVFADRTYLPNGNLVPRSEEGDVLKTEGEINEQVKNLVVNKRVKAEKDFIKLEADTICFHGDHKGCETILKEARKVIAEI